MALRYYYVYIMCNRTGTVLYIGMTGNLAKRSWQHRTGQGSRFSTKYHTTRLVHFEIFRHPAEAIAREKELKGWKRHKKEELIRERNPHLEDLYDEAQQIGMALSSGGYVRLD